MFAVRRALEAPLLSCDQLALAHQPRRAMPPDLMALIDEIAVHARAAVGAVRQREGRPDMRQIDHVLLLAAAGRAFLPGEEAALADAQDTTHPADREACLLRLDEAEGHRLVSFAKKTAAFDQCQPHRFTPKLRHRPVPVTHRTPPGSSVGALHTFRASPARAFPASNPARRVAAARPAAGFNSSGWSKSLSSCFGL